MNIELIGYDLREASSLESVWPQERRSTYLYRLDVDHPLSVDTAVWPQAEDVNPGFTFHPSLRELKNISLQDETRGVLIAVALAVNEERQEDIEFRQMWELVVPAVPESGWTPLGFDVADSAMLSGLSNCGFLPGEEGVEALRAEWSRLLNSHHLFDRLEDAGAFREFAGEHVPEHAPFFVFCIWRVDSGNL